MLHVRSLRNPPNLRPSEAPSYRVDRVFERRRRSWCGRRLIRVVGVGVRNCSVSLAVRQDCKDDQSAVHHLRVRSCALVAQEQDLWDQQEKSVNAHVGGRDSDQWRGF